MSYDAEKAIMYAHKWAHSRNPAFYNFTGQGGDCTNFISQCIHAGTGAMEYGRNGWYYRNLNDRAPAWTSVEFLYDYLVRKSPKQSPSATKVYLSDVIPGDIIQLSFDGEKFGHSLFVVEKGENGILVATHTDDSDYRPLHTYSFIDLRALRIE